MRRLFVVPAALAALAAACARAPTPPPGVVAIELNAQVPADRWSAFSTFRPDGWVSGGHISAGFVHLDSTRIPGDSVRVIFEAALALVRSPPDTGGPGPEGRATIVTLVRTDSVRVTYWWPDGAQHRDGRVAALAAHLLVNRTGGW